MKYTCINVMNKRQKKRFLDFPRSLYGEDLPQDRETERRILNGTHILSSDIEVYPFLVLDEKAKAVCRCALTYYNGDPVAYLGFFEAYDNVEAVRLMLDSAAEKAAADGKATLLGPVDASIYINYRFKSDRFDKVYTGEPYNKEYYPALWEKCGFSISDRYVSNQLRRVESKDIDSRLQRVYDRYVSRGYEFISPNKKSFDACLDDVYYSMMELYSGFSAYKRLTKDQFVSMFSPLKKVLNFSMVKLAYKDGRLRAFCIALPNYGMLTRGRRTAAKILKIMKIKKKPEEYVILYVGAEQSCVGLGGALIHHIRNVLHENRCTSVGALIKEGNVTGEMYKDLYVDSFHYVLYSRTLKK